MAVPIAGRVNDSSVLTPEEILELGEQASSQTPQGYEAPEVDPLAPFTSPEDQSSPSNPNEILAPIYSAAGLEAPSWSVLDEVTSIVRSDFAFALPVEFTAAYQEAYGNPAGDPAWTRSKWSPSDTDLLRAAERYDLHPNDYAQLAYARAPEELEIRARVLGERRENRTYVDRAYSDLQGFATRLGVSVFDPAFLLAGGAVGTAAKGVKATSAGARIAKNSAIAGVADGTVEFSNAAIDPLVSYQDAAIATAASAGVTGILSGAGELISHSAAQRFSQRTQATFQAHQADARGSAGAQQLNSLPRVVEDDQGNNIIGEILDEDDLIFRVLDSAEGIPDANTLPSFGAPVRSIGQSPDAEIRGMGAMLLEDPTKRGMQRQTIAEKAHRVNEGSGPYLRRIQLASKSYWSKRGGTSVFGGVDPQRQTEFDKIVHLVATGEVRGLPREWLDDADIQEAVSALSEGNLENLYLLQNRNHIPGPGRTGEWKPGASTEYTGVKGMENIQADPRYVRRTFSKLGYDRSVNMHGEARVRELFADAIYAHPDNKRYFDELAVRRNKRKASQATPSKGSVAPTKGRYLGRKSFRVDESKRPPRGSVEAPEGTPGAISGWELARSVSAKYLRTVRTLMNEAEADASPYRPSSKADQSAAMAVVERELTEELGEDAKEALELFAEIIAPERQAALPSFAKRKLKFQLDYEKHAPILDIWDWNASTAFASARRNISGHVAMNSVGYADVNDWFARIAAIERRAAGFPKEQAKIAATTDKLKRVTDLVMGHRRNPMGRADEFATIMKRYNMARLLNQVAFSMAGEVGIATTVSGPLRFATSVMGVRKFYRAIRAGDKKTVDSWMALIDDLHGFGSSQVRARLASTVSERSVADAAVTNHSGTIMAALDTQSRKMANASARLSGLAPLTETLRLSIGVNLSKKFYYAARRGKLPMSEKRLRDLGIDLPMWRRIEKSLLAMGATKSPETGRKLPDFDRNWEDAEAFEAFINGIDRAVRRANMDASVGNSILSVSERPVWGVAFQFLSFPQNSLLKHTGSALNMRDTTAAVQILAAGGFSLMGVLAKVWLQASTIKDEQERQAYLDKHLDTRRVALKALYYVPHSSHLPTLMDVGLGATGQETLFSHARNSDLATLGANPISSNPTSDLIDQAFKMPAKMLDGTVTERDAQDFVKLFPMGNHLVVQAITNEFAQYLPDENEAALIAEIESK